MKTEQRSLLSSASLVSVLTLVSRVLGVARDATVAAILGDKIYNDLFNLAFQIPNLARRVLGEGALSAFLVPVYHAEQTRGGQAAAWRFFNRAVSAMTLVAGALTAIAMLAPTPLFIVFGGLRDWLADDPASAAYLAQGALLTRIMAPYLLVLTLVALFMGACHAHERFLTPALGSSAINVVIIAVASLAAWLEPARDAAAQARFTVWLAWAVVGGIGARLALMAPTLWRLGWRPAWAPRFTTPAMRSLMAKMGAAMFAAGVAQLNIAINQILARWTGEGSVTYLYYSNRLVQFPLALLVSAMATAMAPAISRHTREGASARARDLTRFALRALLVAIVPAMVGLWTLGGPILALIFERGQWDAQATANTAFALTLYAVGLPAMAVSRLLVPLYYARGDVRTPVKIAAGALVVNVVANLLLMRTVLSYGGLALGASLAAIFQALILWRSLARAIGPLWDRRLAIATLKCLLASSVMGAVLLVAQSHWLPRDEPTSALARLFGACALVVLGVAVYLAAAWLLRLRELRDALGTLRGRRNRTGR